MSLFIEKIKEYIKETGKADSQLAQRAGIDRSTLSRYLSETQDLTKHEEHYKKLSKVLLLTPEEKTALDALFEEKKIGEKKYKQRNEIKKMIEDLEEDFLSRSTYSFLEKNRGAMKKSGYQVLNGKKEIKTLVFEVLSETFFNQEKPKINLEIALGAHFIYEMIYNFYKNTDKEVEINHLNFIQKELKKNLKETKDVEYIADNFEQLKYTLIFTLLGKKGYYPYYYYSLSNITKEIALLTPYFLSTNSSVILFSRNFESAIFYDDQTIVSFYQSEIEKVFDHLPLLLKQSDSPKEMYGWTPLSSIFNTIEPIPCIGHFFTDEVINHLVREEIEHREEIVKFACQCYKIIREESKNQVSIFSVAGLKEMIKTKEIPILPSQIVRPVTEEELFYFLKSIRDRMKNEPFLYCAINPKKFKIPQNIEIVNTEKKGIVFRCFNQNRDVLSTVFIQEETFLVALRDFIESIIDSKYLYSQEETIAILEECMAGLKINE